VATEQRTFAVRDLSGVVDHVYLGADGIHINTRPSKAHKLCLLVMIGVRSAGRKELVAPTDG
jgi:hypothetical protein